MVHDAFEVAGRPGPILYTCEHASNRVPAPWRPRPADRALLQSHWGYDIGAARVTRSLARRGPGRAVFSRWSRLLLDPNRDPADPTAVLAETDDGAPSFNRRVDLAARVARFHTPFHAAVDNEIRASAPAWVWSIHSFTPVFRGATRGMEAGVLYDDHDEASERLAAAMNALGLRTELNEPYSGKAGLIYSAARHGNHHALPYLEIEVRQDLVATRTGAERIAALLHRAGRSAGF